jgi:hypothetical protein
MVTKEYYKYQGNAHRSSQEELDCRHRLKRAEKAYHDALDACLDGQDPLLWKLSYSG